MFQLADIQADRGSSRQSFQHAVGLAGSLKEKMSGEGKEKSVQVQRQGKVDR